MALASKASVAAAISITALACFAAPKTEAIQVIVGGSSYDVTTFTGSYNDNIAKFNTTDMPWFGNFALSGQLATALASSLGMPNTFGRGPYFANSLLPNRVQVHTYDSIIGTVLSETQRINTDTFAILSPQPPSSSAVPGPLPLLGAASAFGWSRRLRRRLAADQGAGLN